MLVGRVRILIRQPEAQQNTRHFESVVHLRHEWDRASFADKYGALAESFFQRFVRGLEEGVRVRRDPGLALAMHVKLARHGFWQQAREYAFPRRA